MKNIHFVLIAIGAVLPAMPALADVRFGSGNSAFPVLIVKANTESFNLDTGDDQASSVSPPLTLILQLNGNASTNANSQSESYVSGVRSILSTDFEFASATFASAAAASIEFTGDTFAQSLVDNGFATASGGTNFFGYGFIVDTNSMFRLNYNLFSSNSSLDMGSSIKLIDEAGFDPIDSHPFSNTSGTYAASLIAGHSYDLLISSFASAANDGISLVSPGTASAGYDNTYSFSISSVSPVPEPSSWALMIAGIGAAGGMLRRANRTSGKRQGEGRMPLAGGRARFRSGS